jgi:Putative DNA-binding domain
MAINFTKTRERLKEFDFHHLFVEELGWSQPTTKVSTDMNVGGAAFTRRQISQLAGIAVFEVTAQDGRIPDAKTRAAVHKEISATYHENLLIFIDKNRTQSLWYWVKREGSKKYPRDHFYIKGQPGDLFLGKLSGIVFELADFDEKGNVSVLEVANRLRNALDVERVTKKFYGEFQDLRVAFLEQIGGIADDVQRRWYASVLLNRLMFIYFLQRKGFIDKGDLNYLQNKLALSGKIGKDLFYSKFLKLLFFEGFAKPEEMRSAEAKKALGEIKYLNGGLFLPHRIEQENASIRISDKAFEHLFSLFQRYSWNLNDTPGGQDNEISPDILGYIFEKYINQKAFGAYYTRPEITEYLSERTIHRLILDAINTPEVGKKHPIKGVPVRDFRNIAELLMNLDSGMCRELLFTVLPQMSLLDPACGSGAFLVAAMKALINIYAAVIGKIKFLGDASLTDWLGRVEQEHKSISYFIKKTIITDNLYGVDIMEEGAEIARLRLFLALVASAENVEQLEPLPNIDFNILAGNSLLGLMRVNDADFEKRTAQGHFFQRSYPEILAEKNRLIDVYRHASTYAQDLTSLRNDIQEMKDEARATLNDILLSEFKTLGIKYEQATWDQKNGEEGKAQKRNLTAADIARLQPFHWGYEFDKVLHERGGFDAIITNPPWEVFQTNEKEFFQRYASTIKKKSLRIEDWETQRIKLMKDKELCEDWLDYASEFPHQWNWFKLAQQYKNQTSEVNGRAVGNKPNLYSLFTEQCFNLLRNGGLAGIVIPSGIYTDLGTKQLREMLFSESCVTGLFGFENRKAIFENVHRSFKFVVLTFQRGTSTQRFPTAFMRHDVEELESFPEHGAIRIPVDLVRKLSPDSLSIPEFKSEIDLTIAAKLLSFPFLSDSDRGWGIEFYGEELNMTRSAKFFKTLKTPYPLYEGGMIWHFDHAYEKPRYWVSERELRPSFLEKRAKRSGLDDVPKNLQPDYETYRLAIRKIASSTNERTLITTIIPPNAFAGNSLSVHFPFRNSPQQYNELVFSHRELLFLAALMNSFVVDYVLRSRMTTNLNLFYLYQLSIPRLSPTEEAFKSIVSRAARLVCVSPEFDGLAKEVGLRGSQDGVTENSKRAHLKAELDGLIAHLYGLTEEEFTHILGTFPIVDISVKDAALAAYKLFAPKSADQKIRGLIAGGESANLEFKSSARWNLKENRADKVMEQIVVKTVAAFLNVESGGTLLLGVDDSGNVLGLENDYKISGKKNRDSYENWLTTTLLGEFGKDASPLIRITFHEIDGKDVCQLVLKPSPRPIFVKEGIAEHLYIRAGNSTRLLTSREAIEYCKQRWP